ncbi:MAG: DUF2807 domain-containing protein [Bacteroidota bacterium]
MLIHRLKLLAMTLLWATLAPCIAQEIEEISLQPFNKIVLGPHIDLELVQGPKEKASLAYRRIDREDIHLDVDGNTLRIYLDGARISSKDNQYSNNPKKSKYAYSNVKATVTYNALKKLKVRGDDEVVCMSDLSGDRFKLRLFGENEVRLASVTTDKFVASLFGENDLEIDKGSVDKGKYKFFGDNEVDAIGLTSNYARAKSFGESEFRLNVDDLLRVSSFGESSFRFIGDAEVSRGFMFGDNEVYRR